MIKARVYRSSRRQFLCKIIENNKFVQATALGNLLKRGELVVGDYVFLEEDKDLPDSWKIIKLEKRTNEISRLIVREQKKKILASNCDYLIIVMTYKEPKYKQGILDRFLVRASDWGIPPLVVFNKMDLLEGSDLEECRKSLLKEAKRLSLLNVSFFEMSTKNENEKNLIFSQSESSLRNTIKDKTAIFVGQSGVGKSSLISCLSNYTVNLDTKELGKVGKGSHTTTWAELVDCAEFDLIDSPGIRSFSLDDLLGDDLLDLFPDIGNLCVHCQFRDCRHEEMSKGCIFFNNEKILLELEEKIFHRSIPKSLLLSRLQSYKQIRQEITKKPFWTKKKSKN